MRSRWVLLLVGAAALASAALAGRKIGVNLGSRTLSLDSVVVGGKTDVSLDGLKAGFAAPGGTNELATTRGAISAVLHFPGGKSDDRPTKLIAEFTPVRGLPYAKDPSFRVDLARYPYEDRGAPAPWRGLPARDR